jgi:hypothetical protein
MKAMAVVSSIAAAAVVCGAIGFISGSRLTNGHRIALDREVEALDAEQRANLLQRVEEGDREIALTYIQNSLDTHLVNVSESSLEPLSPSARKAVRAAALFRERHPRGKVSPEWDARLAKAVELAR